MNFRMLNEQNKNYNSFNYSNKIIKNDFYAETFMSKGLKILSVIIKWVPNPRAHR